MNDEGKAGVLGAGQLVAAAVADKGAFLGVASASSEVAARYAVGIGLAGSDVIGEGGSCEVGRQG